MKPVEEQLSVIRRGVDRIVPEEELRKKLAAGKPLRVKLGIDPTGFDVHLGHTVVLRKLRQFQELGHQVVLIIGTATAAVGDPSGRDKSREGLTPEQIERNAETYLTQISKVIDISRAEVVRNGNWFNRFGFAEMLRLLGQITMQRMLERDDFEKRLKEGTPIYLHECLYALMQGHDSVEVRADVELGGTEQLFNLMVGRDLQRDAGQEPQVCLTMPILRGLDGVKKMGKSLGNYIGVAEPAREQFGKAMSIPDDLMGEWFTLLTDRPPSEIARLTNAEGNLEKTLIHPMQAKKTLARDIVGFYHGKDAAAAAQAEWEKQFSQKQDPDDIPEATVPAAELQDGKIGIVRLLVVLQLAKSNNEARQKVMEGAVNIGPERTKITDPKATVAVSDCLIVRLGSRRIVQVRIAG
ncbi:MAG TPA: tyrosine--tRNA ligase [Gemmataceae bacterium]|nr:tyrosine--tRNA ligase [Gemmataceae bacterium]